MVGTAEICRKARAAAIGLSNGHKAEMYERLQSEPVKALQLLLEIHLKEGAPSAGSAVPAGCWS